MSEVQNGEASARGPGLERFFATKPKYLMRPQQRAVHHVINRLSQFIRESIDRRQRKIPRDTNERPHQVFLLDGGRGSGKTYTLSSLKHAIEELSRQCCSSGPADAEWQQFFFDEKRGSQEARDLLTELRASKSQRSQVADCMRIIFQSDLIDKESIMETIFGYMSKCLKQELDPLKKAARDGWTGVSNGPEQKKRIDILDPLVSRLSGVAQGWYFARRFGLDSLVRDSVDYGDMVQRWAEESRGAAARIDNWRELIDDYLDARGQEVLVVLLDDSDVEPDLTAQVIDDIRMFLVHPRIVTVLAGNLKTMRESLLHARLREIAASMPTLNGGTQLTATDWRRRIRQMVEEYLEKVLPPHQRLQITRPEHGDKQAGKPDDFKLVADQPLLEYMTRAIRGTRKQFLKAKFKLAIEHLLDRPDAPTTAERKKLDSFLAWWFFAHIYADSLAPYSPRQIATFKAYYEPLLKVVDPDAEFSGLKRLPVVLYDNPANFLLSQRLGDEDVSVLDWLRRQELESAWSGRRQFKVNQRDIGEGSYTYTFLRYQLDVGLGLPVRNNADEVIPAGLLPHPVGRQVMRRFLQPRATPRRQRMLGVSRWINHAAIPGNCAYFNDMQALPDVSFLPVNVREDERRRLQSGAWEAQLADRWLELLDDDQETADDEYMIRYFREIVCQSLNLTADLSSASLLNELDPPDILEKQKLAVYEHFIRDELGMFAASATERRQQWLDARLVRKSSDAAQMEMQMLKKKQMLLERLELFEEMKPVELNAAGYNWPPRAPLRMIALYTALVTDLRRAWHAIRIHEVSPVHMGGTREGSGHETGQRAAFAVLRSRDRMTLYEREDIEAILKRSDWVRAMLKVFAGDNVAATINAAKYSAAVRTETNLESEQIEALFSAQKAIRDTAQVVEEPKDFSRWTKAVRAVGRAACRDWPVHDLSNSKRKPINLEKEFFDNALRDDAEEHEFSVIQPVHPPSDPKLAEERHQRLLKNSRAARNFVWLMYGLAPSLAAVLHTHVMSKAYQAETLLKACNEGEGKVRGLHEADIKEMQGNAKGLYVAALGEIEKWAQLIGSISVLIRYIKIKCLHLDTALLIRELQLDKDASDKKLSDDLDDRVELLRKIGYMSEPQPSESQRPSDARSQVDLFIKTVSDRFKVEKLEKGLAIFPDVAPSTLLGDGWLQDILTRPGLSNQLNKEGFVLNKPQAEMQKEDPLSVSGIFGETELWLWSASRSLRKLAQALVARYKEVWGEEPPDPRQT